MKGIGKWWMGVFLSVGLSVQAGIVWDVDFSEVPSSAATAFQAGDAAILRPAGQIVLDAGSVPGGIVGLRTSSDETGNATTFNGAPLYNFYNHQVSLRFDIASIAGTPNGPDGRNAFFCYFGELDMSEGVLFRLEQLNTGTGDRWRLACETRVAAQATERVVATFSAQPTALSFELKGTRSIIGVKGAIITGTSDSGLPGAGSTIMEWPIDDLSANIKDYVISFGVFNIGAPLARTVVALDAFQAEVSADQISTGSNPSVAASEPQVSAPLLQSLVLVDTFDTGGVTTNALNHNQAARQSGSAAPCRLSTTTKEFLLSSGGELLLVGEGSVCTGILSPYVEGRDFSIAVAGRSNTPENGGSTMLSIVSDIDNDFKKSPITVILYAPGWIGLRHGTGGSTTETIFSPEEISKEIGGTYSLADSHIFEIRVSGVSTTTGTWGLFIDGVGLATGLSYEFGNPNLKMSWWADGVDVESSWDNLNISLLP